jgi:hypothetical protein
MLVMVVCERHKRESFLMFAGAYTIRQGMPCQSKNRSLRVFILTYSCKRLPLNGRLSLFTGQGKANKAGRCGIDADI